jgi:hypothetical protein
MRNILFFTFFLALASSSVKSQVRNSFEQISFERFDIEMRQFITYIKTESLQGGKFNVYLAKFTDNNGIEPCVTFEYIFNSLRPVSDLQSFDYYTYIDSSLVLLSFDVDFIKNYNFLDSTVNRVSDVTMITDRLYKGAFFGDGPAWVVCFGEKVTSITKYRGDSALPEKSKIFIDRSKGAIREIDRFEFKRKRKRDN